jgi:hypothetical protein
MTVRPETSDAGLSGIVTLSLYGGDGELVNEQVVKNLITDAGDLYYATRGLAAVVPSATTDATKVTGMKLGTGTTAPTKASTAAALITYKTGSNLPFDASYPQIANLGTTLGVNAVYRTTWGAGVATDTALTELVIVNDAASNLTSSAANTISRVVFSAINKGAADILVATWNHKFLG